MNYDVINFISSTDFPYGILIAGEVEEKEELKNLLKRGRELVDREIFTYLKNWK